MAEIRIKVRGVEQVKDFISSLPRHLRGIATAAAAEWFIGNGQRGLKHYPPYKHVTRKAAYGRTFQSDKQRRYVMARIREGRIDPGFPHRTGNYQRGWKLDPETSGARTRIYNDVPYAQFVGGDETQARLNKRVGWRMVSEIISTNYRGAIRHAQSKVNAWIKARKK